MSTLECGPCDPSQPSTLFGTEEYWEDLEGLLEAHMAQYGIDGVDEMMAAAICELDLYVDQYHHADIIALYTILTAISKNHNEIETLLTEGSDGIELISLLLPFIPADAFSMCHEMVDGSGYESQNTWSSGYESQNTWNSWYESQNTYHGSELESGISAVLESLKYYLQGVMNNTPLTEVRQLLDVCLTDKVVKIHFIIVHIKY